MSRRTVEIRPARREDFDKFTDGPLPCRVQALAVQDGDELLGVGGIAFLPDGTLAAFVHQTANAKRYKVSFHRAGLMTMAQARRLGYRRIVATTETNEPRAKEWLARLGFNPGPDVNGVTVWVWTNESGS